MSRLISRDPFARQELHRVRVYNVDACAWCASVRQTRDAVRSYLFRYDVHTDGGRVFEGSRLFCCKACRDAYYGEGR